MKIGVDARLLTKQKTGIGYFLDHLLTQMLSLDHKNQYYLLSDRPIVFPLARSCPNVATIIYQDGIVFRKSFYYRWKLSSFLEKQGLDLDVFWAPSHIFPSGLPLKTKKLLTVHDFTYLVVPKACSRYNRLIMKMMFPSSVKEADYIACVSHTTQNDLENLFAKEIKGKKVCTIYNGGNGEATTGKNGMGGQREEKEAIPERIAPILGKRFILFVGTIEPRKNLSVLVDAAPLLKGKAQIVVAGKLGWETKEMTEKIQHTENLIYLGYITDEEKEVLMKNCFCQIEPSIYEGFGLPVVECMQEGRLALVADNSSLREIVEMPELRFETHSAENLADQLNQLISHPDLYDKALQYCNKRARDFSWKEAAKQYLTLLEACGNENTDHQ